MEPRKIAGGSRAAHAIRAVGDADFSGRSSGSDLKDSPPCL